MRWLLVLAFTGLAGAAQADPCEGLLPGKGATFSGIVRYVVDGDGFCVSDDKDPKTWVEVRLADFNAPELSAKGGPEAKNALGDIAIGRRAVCIAGRKSYDRVVASCKIGGIPIRALMLEQGISEGGN